MSKSNMSVYKHIKNYEILFGVFLGFLMFSLRKKSPKLDQEQI